MASCKRVCIFVQEWGKCAAGGIPHALEALLLCPSSSLFGLNLIVGKVNCYDCLVRSVTYFCLCLKKESKKNPLNCQNTAAVHSARNLQVYCTSHPHQWCHSVCQRQNSRCSQMQSLQSTWKFRIKDSNAVFCATLALCCFSLKSHARKEKLINVRVFYYHDCQDSCKWIMLLYNISSLHTNNVNTSIT